jgi:uncharacterized protein (TIGR03790 family)
MAGFWIGLSFMKAIVASFACFCIAESQIACRHPIGIWRHLTWPLLLWCAALTVGLAHAQPVAPAVAAAPAATADVVPMTAAASAAAAPAPAGAPGPAVVPRWTAVPVTNARLRGAEIGLVINSADPYSVQVGEYYLKRRGLLPSQVLRVELPLRAHLKPEEFETLRLGIQAHFGPDIQALALAWTQPYAVDCNSITGALALGFDAALCRNSCAPSRVSGYANSASRRPFSDHGMRLSMLLAAHDVEAARHLIDRGVAADHTLGLRGSPPVNVYFMSTDDAARNVRTRLYPPPGLLRRVGVQVHVEPAGSLRDAQRVLLVQTGSARLENLQRLQWVDGGLGDHLTSYGGQLTGDSGQSKALEWMSSGATASHGTVSEPCNHLQKFPHPQWLLVHYLQGSSAIEAYWKSVLWPQQALFVGEPLAAPFARR